MDYVLTITTGVFSGILASGLFLWFSFSYFKPTVEISPHLAINDPEDENPYIEIKFINRTKRAINDVRVELLKSEIKNVNGGTFINHVEILKKEVYVVAPYNKNDPDARYAFRFTEHRDIKTIWDNDLSTFITIMVHASDSMSGFSQSFRKELRNIRSTIKVGMHEFGDSFNVARNTNGKIIASKNSKINNETSAISES